jgi:glycosyltransferase involved in cell wall biosynthesis
LRILYFYQYFSTPKGSWGTRVYEFASEWVKLGHEVTVVTSVYSKSDLKAIRFIEDQFYDGIKLKVINVNIDNTQQFYKRIFSFIVYAITSSWYALTLKSDVVIASSGPITVGIPGLLARYIRGRTLVFETRDLWPEGAIELGIIKNKFMQRLAYWFEKRCYKASSLIISLSSGMKDHIHNKYGKLNIEVVTNAANIDLFSKPVFFDGRSAISSKKYAIYTGNIGEVNNSKWLLNTAIELTNLKRDDIKILLVGEGQQRKELELQAVKLGINNFIRWDLIPKNSLIGLVQNAMVSLVPLKGTPVLDTSSPNKFFESLAAGIPVIQNTNGWMKKFIDEHKVGYTIDPNDPKRLAQTLIALDSDPGELESMGIRASAIAKKEFDKVYLAGKMLKSIEAIFK